MKKSLALATLLVFMAAAIAFQYYITSVPELEPPVTLGQAWPMNEGNGSISVSLVGSEGHEFRFGLRGDPESGEEMMPAFYIRNPDLIPYVHWPSVGGQDERDLFRLLEDWIERHVTPDQQDRLRQDVPGTLADLDGELVTLWEIYSVLQERNQR